MFKIFKKLQKLQNFIYPANDHTITGDPLTYEYCTRCNANLKLQNGFDSAQPYWVCRGCGEMLINPMLETESNIVWICDECGAILNIQSGFSEKESVWYCRECGGANHLQESEVYASEDEFQADKKNPYRGLADEAVLALSAYEEIARLNDDGNIILVRHRETGINYVKKLLSTYDKSIYRYLMERPVEGMPQILELYESDNCLIVIEEYIAGKTVLQLMNEQTASPPKLPEQTAIWIAKGVCQVLLRLHRQPGSIIHRDVKPANIIVTPDKKIYLLDMNVAKWYNPDKADDTRYMGTQYYAAPEQVGYGFTASSDKSDIYAVGMLLNVMITGNFPKTERATGKIWPIIEKCISLEAKDRYTARELMSALNMLENKDETEESDQAECSKD